MSRSQKFNSEDNSKIIRDTSAKSLESAIQCTSATINSRFEKLNPSSSKPCRLMLSTQSDGSIIKNQAGLKQKFVSRVKLWGSKGVHNNESASFPKSDPATITLDLENLNLANETSEDTTMYRSDLVKAKDSLENVLEHKSDRIVGADVVNSKSSPYPSSSYEKEISPEMPSSDPFLGGSSGIDSTTSRVLTWDPWNKLGRKSKRENKRRKPDKSPHHSRDGNRNGSPHRKCKDHTAGDEPRTFASELVNVDNPNLVHSPHEYQENFEYQPYRQTRRSVEFVNEVLVVYFTGDEVIAKCTEPLKKELDQQLRNKEMRRGHIPCTMMGKKQCKGEDYMAAWFKK